MCSQVLTHWKKNKENKEKSEEKKLQNPFFICLGKKKEEKRIQWSEFDPS